MDRRNVERKRLVMVLYKFTIHTVLYVCLCYNCWNMYIGLSLDDKRNLRNLNYLNFYGMKLKLVLQTIY